MNPSSIKSPSIINSTFAKIILICALLGPYHAHAAKYGFQLNFDARYGVHTVGRPDTATHRHTFEIEQRVDINSQWSGVLGARGEVEAAYATQPDRYGGTEVTQYNSQQFLLRDNFIQFKDGSFRLRAGYQQVVWGETFGFYYADIVNPKDYREGGLGDLSRNRLTSPILNTQWIFAQSSIQLLYIPVPIFNLLPRTGSDFSPLQASDTLSTLPLTVKNDPEKKVSRPEYGARVTQQIGSYDFSLFYLNYSDRMPIYSMGINLLPTPTAIATPDYKPLQTFGGTLTVDFDGFLVRTEVVQNLKREFNYFSGTSSIETEKSDELIYVIGLDPPQLGKWTFNLQYSDSRIKSNTWAFRKSVVSTASLRVARPISSGLSVETTAAYYTSDSSQLVQALLTAALTNQSELALGVDRFDGKSDTEFGRMKNASRIWIMFKAALKR